MKISVKKPTRISQAPAPELGESFFQLKNNGVAFMVVTKQHPIEDEKSLIFLVSEECQNGSFDAFHFFRNTSGDLEVRLRLLGGKLSDFSFYPGQIEFEQLLQEMISENDIFLPSLRKPSHSPVKLVSFTKPWGNTLAPPQVTLATKELKIRKPETATPTGFFLLPQKRDDSHELTTKKKVSALKSS